MKQQADPEFKALRRIVEVLAELPPSTRKRVLDFVNARVSDPETFKPAQPALPGV